MSDTELRDLRRAIVAGDASLKPKFISTLRRLGITIKIQRVSDRALNQKFRVSLQPISAVDGRPIIRHRTRFPLAGLLNHTSDPNLRWMVVQFSDLAFSDQIIWNCTHQHATTKDAKKCAYRRVYTHITNDPNLLLEYIDITKH